MNIHLLFTERLRDLREDRGLSQNKLGMALGISYRSIGRYEKGQQEPTMTFLVKLAKYFGVSINYLIGLED